MWRKDHRLAVAALVMQTVGMVLAICLIALGHAQRPARSEDHPGTRQQIGVLS